METLSFFPGIISVLAAVSKLQGITCILDFPYLRLPPRQKKKKMLRPPVYWLSR